MEIVQLWMRDFFAPCVYAWTRKGQWLYVGQSRNGLARLGSGHPVIKPSDVLPDDELLVWRVPVSELIELEKKLIVANRPVHNVKQKPVILVRLSVLPEQIEAVAPKEQPPRRNRLILSEVARQSLDASAIKALVSSDYSI